MNTIAELKEEIAAARNNLTIVKSILDAVEKTLASYEPEVTVAAEALTEAQIDAAINTKLFWHAFEIKKMSGKSLADCVNEVVAGIREMQSVCGHHSSERGGDD
ncbi:hypothetical protein [Marinobacterium sp. BA1]|uniref:hypothetical protein n=1 Tax=Marinobacterium sp. BA1 TaxID=3138931 RepID=UPI0032E62220